MPGNGYPMRLLLPGYEGNMNVKYLRRIKLVDQPAMSYYEARTYSQILPNGKAYQFYFLQEVKSFITHPSLGLTLKGPGYYEISGIAYSGTGRIAKVMVSADGGKSWAQAALQEPVLPQGVHALPHALALGRRARGAAKPRLGRGRQRAADARASSSPQRGETKRPFQLGGLSRASTTTAHQLGGRRTGRSSMSTRKLLHRSRVALACASRRGARRMRPSSAKPITEQDIAGLGHQHPAATAPACRPAAARPRRAPRSTRRNARVVPRRERQGRPGTRALVGGPPLDAHRRAQDHRQLLAHATTLFDFMRRAMPWPDAADAHRRRGLCADRLHPRAEQAHRRRTT